MEDENKIIFIHIPKAAGNGITQSLFGKPSSGHYFLQKYHDDDELKFKSYKKFTVVRNPWDRFVSAFHYLHSEKGGIGVWDNEFKKLYLKDIKTFKEFIDKMIADQAYRKKVMNWTHFIPQTEFFILNGNADLSLLDCVCRFEYIESDFESLKSALGKDASELKKVNKSQHNHFKDYYNEGYMVDFVGELYAEDIQLLNYEY
ncbi:hypothetical protein PPE03_21690 [Pseudoalteromonas peptidolytica]|nr:hypothetical protein PPE03_21690 [Pseudoalteromonas peptidolytica]